MFEQERERGRGRRRSEDMDGAQYAPAAPVQAAAPVRMPSSGGSWETHSRQIVVPISATLRYTGGKDRDQEEAAGGGGGGGGGAATESAGAGGGGAATESAGAGGGGATTSVTATGGGDQPLTIAALEGPAAEAIEEQDAVGATLAYTGSVSEGGSTPSGFGVTRSRLGRFQNVVVSPPASGTIRVTASLTYTIRWKVRSGTGPGGQANVPNATAAGIHQGNYLTAVSDLTPNVSDLGGRPPRTQFWAQDLTQQHELIHANDRSRLGREGIALAQTWLGSQTAANQAAVVTLLSTAWTNQLRAHIDANMTYTAKERRAYGDGVSAYRTRATAIRTRGAASQYPAAPGTTPTTTPTTTPATPPASGGT